MVIKAMFLFLLIAVTNLAFADSNVNLKSGASKSIQGRSDSRSKKEKTIEQPRMNQIREIVLNFLINKGNFTSNQFELNVIDMTSPQLTVPELVIEVTTSKDLFGKMAKFLDKDGDLIREQVKRVHDKKIVFEVVEQ